MGANGKTIYSAYNTPFVVPTKQEEPSQGEKPGMMTRLKNKLVHRNKA